MNKVHKIISSQLKDPLIDFSLYAFVSYVVSISLIVLIALPSINSSLWNIKLNQFVGNKRFVLFFISQLSIFAVIKIQDLSQGIKTARFYKRPILLYMTLSSIAAQIIALILFDSSPLSRMLIITTTSALLVIQTLTILSNLFKKSLLERLKRLDTKNALFEFLAFLIPTVLIGVFYLIFVIMRHYTFNTYSRDLALYDQSVWLFSKFSAGTNTILGLPAFGDHLEPPLLLLAPLYWIYSSPYVLLVVQVLAVLVGGIPIYKLAKKKLHSSLAASFILTSYLTFFGIQRALSFDFHPLVLALPFLSYALYFLEEKRMRALVATVFPILLIKENLSMYTAFIGLYLFLKKQYRRIGLSILLISLAYFILALNVLLPLLTKAPYRHFLFANFGADFPSAAINIFVNPLLALKTMITPTIKLETILITLGSGAFLILAAPSYIFLMIPLFAERFLGTRSVTWIPAFHHSSVMAPYIAFASIIAIERLGTFLKKHYYLIAIALSSVVLVNTLIINSRGRGRAVSEPIDSLRKTMAMLNSPERSTEIESLYSAISQVEPNKSVLSQDVILPHLAHREGLFQLGGYMSSTIQADYVLLNEDFSSWPISRSDLITIEQDYIHNKNYKLLFHKDKTYLFKKKSN